ncbi:hypothetical protein M406DRAFT_53338 [Cryphonectria parasitica EP155]|uniref:Uncharacterized protein n=1 Tax=Cryphonectria parasitica (strain ATCC 38755 / EP155) TaxID=660469 RepID=A0A9P5CLK0_CRYP1|nr:uncharacterized protein M406DRAFT_53338 [Cryphonectria parasitica EP155]KAF3762096.1 hypothetical protein M406DRAFT_53338 [Cryphonectria parasitica EP155]
MFDADWSQCSFKQFFPAWNKTLIDLMVNECNSTLDLYRTHPHSAYALAGCLLDSTPSFRQSEMNAVSVMLGLTPTAIGLIGPTTVQTSMLGLRKPILALMVALGTPAVGPQRGRDFVMAVKRMGKPFPIPSTIASYDDDISNPKHKNFISGICLGFVKIFWTIWPLGVYLVVMGCMANNAYLAYQLGCWCICSFSPPASWLPSLWMYLALVVHIVSVMTMWRLVTVSGGPSTQADTPMQWLLWKLQMEMDELTPLVAHVREGLPGKDDWFQLLVWALYVGASLHVLFGLVVLAGMLFISMQDAAFVVARYVACTLVCRLIVVVENVKIRKLGFNIEQEVDWSDVIDYTY